MDDLKLPRITLPLSTSPRVSILIPTNSRADRLQRCLESLQKNISPDIRYEVVLMLNAANQDVITFIENEVRGVVLARSTVNLGVAGGNNRARTHASGEYLVLLHDDTEVHPGWLESLITTADAHPEAGVIGSRIFNPDHTLQAEGWILWQNAQTTPPWGLSQPESDRPDALRAVDYTPTCSLLTRASTWDAIGGLDENIYPAYYVDVDYCLSVRSHGQTVLCQPQSQLMHHRGSSSKQEFREFMAARNRDYFIKKWSHVLNSHPPFPTSEHFTTDLINAQRKTDETAQKLAAAWKPLPPSPPPDRFSEVEQDLANLKRQLELTIQFSAAIQCRLEKELENYRAATPSPISVEVDIDLEQKLLKSRSKAKAKIAEARHWRRLATNLKKQLRDIKKSRWWRWHQRLLRIGHRLRHPLARQHPNRSLQPVEKRPAI